MSQIGLANLLLSCCRTTNHCTVSLHGIIAGCVCPCNYRSGVVAALRATAERVRAEGTFAWALEQMKAGKRVTLPNDPRLRYAGIQLIQLGLTTYDDAFYVCQYYHGSWVRGSKAFVFEVNDFERADWQILPAPPAAEERNL